VFQLISFVKHSHTDACSCNILISRGRPKAEISLSAETESWPKVTQHIRPKPYVPPKVNSVWADTTIEASKSRLASIATCCTSDIFYPYPMWVVQCVINARAHSTNTDTDNAAAFSVIFTQLVHCQANDSLRLAHSGLRNSSSVTYFRQTPNLPTTARARNRKCTDVWYDCFRPKPNVHVCQFIHIWRRNRSQNSVDLYWFGSFCCVIDL